MREPRAYSIEDAVFSGRFSKLRENADGVSVAEQREYVSQIIAVFDLPMPTLTRMRGRLSINSWAYPLENKIRMGALAGPAMVCHEVAHLLAPPTNGEPWHSEKWESAYVECVAIVLGRYHALRLDKAFKKARKPRMARAAARGVR